MPRHMVIRLVVAGLMLIGPYDRLSDAQVFNWGGTWVSAPDQVLIVSHRSANDRGWQELVDDLEQITPYSLTIEQTDQQFNVKFPRGVANPLNGSRFPAVGDRTDVLNFGEYWEKQMFSSQETNSARQLTVTKLNGKWSEAKPEEAVPAATDFQVSLRLVRGKTPMEMMLGVTVSSRNGELRYLQIFRRATETVAITTPHAEGRLALVSLLPAAETPVGRDDLITAELSYQVTPFTTGRFFINAVASTAAKGVATQVRESEVKLASGSGRVQVSFRVSSAFSTPGVVPPLRIQFRLHQQVGELGSSQIIAETALIEYREKY